MAHLDIRREDDAAKGRRVTEVEGRTAELTCSRAGPHLLILEHAGAPAGIGGGEPYSTEQ